MTEKGVRTFFWTKSRHPTKASPIIHRAHGAERHFNTLFIIPPDIAIAQATLDSTMEGYGISVIYATFNPRGDLEYTIKILLDKSIDPGSFVSTDGNYECVVYLIKDMTVWEANGLGDSFYSLGYYHIEITGRSDD